MGFLNGKKALIVGAASQRSIAYGMARAIHQQGGQLALTYQNAKLGERVKKMADEFDSTLTYECDVSSDQSITAAFEQLQADWSTFDILIHSVAFAPASQIQGDFVDNIEREGFRIAHDISSYSFAALAKHARPMLNANASLLTLTYFGAEKAVPNYNVMGLAKASLEANVRYLAASLGPQGIRVNAISAGPIRTLAASGIKDFRKLLDQNASITPLRRNVSIDDVGHTAAFLCSDLAAGITGEIIHVDAGAHAVGISPTSTD